MSQELVVPASQELEALSPAQRWSLEDALADARTHLSDFNDEELRRWVEVEGKTQTEIAELVGRSQQRIAQRCASLGIQPASNRGRPRNTTPSNSPDDVELVEGVEVVDGEIVEGDDPPSPKGSDDDPERARLENIVWWVSDCPDAVAAIPVEDVVRSASPDDLHEWTTGFAKGMAALRALKRRLEQA